MEGGFGRPFSLYLWICLRNPAFRRLRHRREAGRSSGWRAVANRGRRIVLETSETEQVRRRLTSAWRAVGNRLIEEGYKPAGVTTTMVTVAVASWSGLRAPGRSGVSSGHS